MRDKRLLLKRKQDEQINLKAEVARLQSLTKHTQRQQAAVENEIIKLNASSNSRDKRRAKGKLIDLAMRVQNFGATHGFSDIYPLDNAEYQYELDKYEFKVGSYSSVKKVGMKMTADHEPQDAVMKNIKQIYSMGN